MVVSGLVDSRELDSARKYELAFARHINPRIGRQLAERLNREQVRAVMDAARIRRKRPAGERGGPIKCEIPARLGRIPRERDSWNR